MTIVARYANECSSGMNTMGQPTAFWLDLKPTIQEEINTFTVKYAHGLGAHWDEGLYLSLLFC